MSVGVDESGSEREAGAIDSGDARSSLKSEARADVRDAVALGKDIGLNGRVSRAIDDGAAGKEKIGQQNLALQSSECVSIERSIYLLRPILLQEEEG